MAIEVLDRLERSQPDLRMMLDLINRIQLDDRGTYPADHRL